MYPSCIERVFSTSEISKKAIITHVHLFPQKFVFGDDNGERK